MLFCFLIYNTYQPLNATYKIINEEKTTKPISIPTSHNDLKENESLFILTIPKINLEKSIYSLNDSRNNIEENVTILKGSILPENSNSIIFLAAHSGPGNIAFFNELDQLSINDQIFLTYKKNLLLYEITEILEQDKDGFIEVLEQKKKSLVLTTCSKTDQAKQLIIIAQEKTA